MVDVKKEVNKAFKNKYAIGHFNINNLESFQAVKAASVNTKMPVFMGTSNTSIKYMDFENIINLKKGLDKTKVILHLDHGNYKNAVKCINNGYDSVMFDGSKFSFKKNIKLTKKVVKLAHDKGVFVEAEIGRFEKNGLTSIKEAEEFYKQTNVDLLAVSIGNAHGYYKYMPVIDIKRLQEIKKAVDCPLVLHGASGLDKKIIKTAIKNGVVKINVDSELRWSFTKTVKEFLDRNSPNKLNKKTFDMRNYLGNARKSYERKVVEKIKLFGQLKT